jgi:hypothetical protein
MAWHTRATRKVDTLMAILYFIACMLGGIFIIAIPFAGLVVLLLRNDPPVQQRLVATSVPANVGERQVAAVR